MPTDKKTGKTYRVKAVSGTRAGESAGKAPTADKPYHSGGAANAPGTGCCGGGALGTVSISCKEEVVNPGSAVKVGKWDARFIQMAHIVACWSSCFQTNRKIGAVIVRDKRIITTGYNGAPSGIKSCVEKGECLRQKLGIPSGTRQEICYAVHAEQNAIVQAAKLGISIQGATLYCTHQPCVICAKMIINAGIARVVYSSGYPDEFSLKLFDEAGVLVERIEYNF